MRIRLFQHAPNTVLGFRADGRPIFPIAGGSQDPPTDPSPEDDDDDDEPFDKKRAQAKIRKVNSEAAALRKRAEAAEAKLKEADDGTKSDIQKATDRAQEAEKRAQEAELRALRLEVATSKGLTAAQAKRLHGSTVEELEADADELLEVFKPGEKKPTPGQRPKEAMRPGSSNEDEPTEHVEMDPAKLAEAVAAAGI